MASRKASSAGIVVAGVAALLLVCAASACRSRDKLVRIAVALPLTGDLGSEGESLRRAVILAVEQANEARRLPFRVEVAAFDDRADPAEAYNVANLIVDDPRIVAVIGHYSSDCSERAARVYARAPLAMISPASTNPDITRAQLRPGWPGARVVFRLVPTDDVQGDFAAQFIDGEGDVHPRSQSLYHRNDPAQFLLQRHRHRARPGRFTANVEDDRTLLYQKLAMGNGKLRRGKMTAVREGIRSDINDAHHPGAGEVKLEFAAGKNHRAEG